MGWLRFGLWSLWTLVISGVMVCVPRKWHHPILKFWSHLMLAIAQAKMTVVWQVPQDEVLKLPHGIVISNHQSYLDIVTLQNIFPWAPHMLTKKELYWIPIFGWAMKRFGNIKIDRQQGQNFIDDQIGQLFQEGKWVYFAPEGTRSVDGKLAPTFKSGAFRTAHRFKVPIVVVGIQGARNVLPKGSFWIRANQTFTVTVLAILNPSESPDILKSRAYALIQSVLGQS